MSYKEILIDSSKWIDESDIDVGPCIECCYSCSYRKLRNPLNNKLMSCEQLQEMVSSSKQCRAFRHYELQKNND